MGRLRKDKGDRQHLWHIIMIKGHTGKEAGERNQESIRMVLNFTVSSGDLIMPCKFAWWEFLDHVIHLLDLGI